MSVYVVTHKNYKKPEIACYKTLLVGAYKGHILGEYVLNDDNGDNISEKNANYCELTGLYWIWKNTNDDYVGIVHYRRYFCNSLSSKKILKEKTILKKLKSYDMIVPFRRKLKTSVLAQYCERSGFKKDIELTRKVISELYHEYLNDFDDVFNNNYVYFYNMFITKSNILNEYCEWLFNILFKVEELCDISEYDNYQKRIFGFLSERLFTVLLKYKKYKLCETGVINTEEKHKFPKSILIALKRFLYG